ncbi:glycosyltransferase [Halpernia frigidisoli]|uniref:Glycosyltransferase involved in cell wall bisynthesis n=1 Tax=Halpernia frigidisoli TaxID=1125876 RepID=A0A1I3DLT3_9FLAO|nr:glycosyltransferase [Halpernia frigidisoli]SFH87680.1 Glycosyltransferase involved in cell wall bisynthesis [Halpernia frigidisoli]
MKIAVIAKTRLPIAEPFRGGLESFTHSLCQEYLRLGHEITLYAHKDSDPKLNVKGFYGEEKRDSDYFSIYEDDEYLSILNDIETNDFDVVHNNSTHELPILWGAKSSVPLITTIHTPPISKLKAAIKIASHSKNLHFVLPSRSFQKTWEPFLDNGSTVIYNGVDLYKWPPVRENAEYLFWFGRIVHAKGLDIVIDAAHEVNMPLKFAGPIDDETYFEEQIKPRIRRSDLYLGHLKQSEIQLNMKAAAAIVSAVRWEEPFGLTNIEAMASGVPVAGFERGAFRELIDIKSGVVSEQKNVKSLAKAITDAMALDSKKVRQHAKQFSLQIMAENYIKYFEDLI